MIGYLGEHGYEIQRKKYNSHSAARNRRHLVLLGGRRGK